MIKDSILFLIICGITELRDNSLSVRRLRRFACEELSARPMVTWLCQELSTQLNVLVVLRQQTVTVLEVATVLPYFFQLFVGAD